MHKAFTNIVPSDHRHAVLVDVTTSLSVIVDDEQKTISLSAKALVDTGASCSFISKRIAQAAHLTYYRMAFVHSAQGRVIEPVYRADVTLPNEITFQNWQLLEFVGGSDFDVIIGMDILSHGDMALTTEAGKMYFSFRVPSAEKHIDFCKS